MSDNILILLWHLVCFPIWLLFPILSYIAMLLWNTREDSYRKRCAMNIINRYKSSKTTMIDYKEYLKIYVKELKGK